MRLGPPAVPSVVKGDVRIAVKEFQGNITGGVE